ncbi:peptidylprolyl isomerase [Brackiella oedipodis]|uniref:peptidylprolyl isomerase n=1 Tax=Brackiella oedipodis TaxID=124225 RepID=UPI000683FDF4|nr:peptidylprolyl isomerase [Brackiella oedipodis]
MTTFKKKATHLLLLPILAAGLGLHVQAMADTKQPTKKAHTSKKAKTTKKSAAPNTAFKSGQFADGVAAIVNTEVITQRQLENRLGANRLMQGNGGDPQQVLQDMIDQKLIEDEAGRFGMGITDERLKAAIKTIAARNNLSIEQFQQEAKRHNIDWDAYTNELRNQMLVDEMQNRVLSNRISITDQDVDAFLKQNPTGVSPDYKPEVRQGQAPPPEKRIMVERSFEPKAIAFKHIFIRVPDNASEAVTEKARKKANEALRKLRGSSSFEAIARQYSDAPEASSGGDLGIRMFEDWPKLFVTVTKNVKDGHVSGVFKAPNGFHILKVVERRGLIKENRREVVVQAPPPKPQVVEDPRVIAARQEGPVEVTEAHVKHILVKSTPVFTFDQAHQKIEEIQNRINNGMSFDEAAERFSDDTSAPLGGDIGWLAPGTADPAFEQTVNQLELGQLSQPVKTRFGWHLIEVVDRRTEDKKEDIRRNLAKEAIYTQRADAVIADWMAQLRARAYIDNRLTGQVLNRNSPTVK